MIRILPRTITVALLTILAVGLRAQTGGTPLTPQEYHDLKLQGLLPPGAYAVDPHAHPSHGTSNGGARGGGMGGPCSMWVEPTDEYLQTGSVPDDGSSEEIDLPFTFNLYGTYYNSCYINNNGNISFGGPYGAFTASSFPDPNFVMIAPFWGDVDLTGTGSQGLLYHVTAHALYVNWVGVGYFPGQTDLTNTFQLIITDGTDPFIGLGNNVSFCYLDMQWTTGSASGGVGGFGGTPATVGANLGNGVDYIQIGRFDHEGVDYDGPFGASDGVSWLDNRHFEFNTEVSSSNIPPIPLGNQLCDTIPFCTGIQSSLSLQFTGPEPDQIVTGSVTPPDLSDFAVIENTSGQTAQITVQFTPQVSEVGYHTLTFYGTDNGAPSQSAGYQVVLNVLLSPAMEPGAVTVCDTGTPVDLYGALQGSPSPGGTWTAPDGTDHSDTLLPGEDPPGEYQYAVNVNSACPATSHVTVTTIAHVYAGGDSALAYCSWDPDVDLFTLIPNNPQTGGSWLSPVGGLVSPYLDPSADPQGVYKYYLQGTTPCPNDTAYITLAIPQAVDPGHDTSIVFCRDATPFSLRSKLGGTPDATGTWANILGATVPDLFDPATGTFGVYTYTVPATAPCPTLSASLNITIDPLPVAGDDASLVSCANDPDVPLFPLLTGNPDDGGHWLDANNAPHSGTLDPSLSLSGTYHYITVGPGTCAHLTDTAAVVVQINPVPVITFTADPDSGCHPLLVHFTNTTDPIYVGNSCIWDPGDGTGTVQECGGFDHLYEQPGWYHVKLKVTTPEGCTDQLIVPGAVLVDPAPQATFIWSPDTGSAGNSTFVFTATDPHAVDFLWSFPLQDVDSSRQVARTFEDAISGVYQVCLGVADRYGCTDTLCQDVAVDVVDLYVPTAFTPNGDGRNDVLYPVNSNMVLNDYEFQIYDRWGHVIFETRDTAEGWNGRHGNSGAVLPEGTYVWRLSARPLHAADKIDHFGTVTLMK